MKRVVYKAKVQPGAAAMSAVMFVYVLTAFFIFYAAQLGFSAVAVVTVAVTALPLVLLHFLIWPITRSFFSDAVVLYSTGIDIDGTFLSWKKIKSISFQTGRPSMTAFFRGPKLPMYQSFYVLDKQGKEYSAVIDIDHVAKEKRKENHLRGLREMLYAMNKEHLLSDWAQKR